MGVLSFRAIVAAITFFGVAGMAAKGYQLAEPASLGAAVVAGLAAIFGVAFVMRSLHRLKAEGPEGAALAQELVDRFSRDMETVLRELGVSDLRIPKKMRGLAASSLGLLRVYESALAGGEASLTEAIKAALPDGTEDAELTAEALASYLFRCVSAVERETLASLQSGAIEFPEVSQPK